MTEIEDQILFKIFYGLVKKVHLLMKAIQYVILWDRHNFNVGFALELNFKKKYKNYCLNSMI